MGRFQVQTPPDALPDWGTQLHYKAPTDLQVKNVKTQWLTSGEWDCPLDNGSKLMWGSQIAVKKKEKIIKK